MFVNMQQKNVSQIPLNSSIKKLRLRNGQLEAENQILKNTNELLLRNKEINNDLYNMVKAIMVTLKLREIEIDNRTIEEVKNYDIYTEQSYLKFAKTIKLIAPEQVINIQNIHKDLEER